MRVAVIRLLIHLCWCPVILATPQENEGQFMEETQTESTWEVRAIEVLEQMLEKKIRAPPPSPKKPFYHYGHQDAERRQKAWYVSSYIDESRFHAQNILTHIKNRNATASKSLWETSARKASEARQLAEEAASLAKHVVANLSEEGKRKAVAAIASHIEDKIGSNNRRTALFYNLQKMVDAFLVNASKEILAHNSRLKSELCSFQLMAKVNVDAAREIAEAAVNQSIKYLRLAESLWYLPFSTKWTSLVVNALNAKDEAVGNAREAFQESLNYVHEKFDTFKRVNNEKAGHFEDAIEDALKNTKSAHKETIEHWKRTNRDAMALSRTFFNFTEVQSVLGRAKSAIDRTKVDIANAKRTGKWGAIEKELVKMSDSAEKVVKAGSDLGSLKTFQLDIGQSMYGMWALFYGIEAKGIVLRLKRFFSKINQINPSDLREAVIKWDEANKKSQHLAEISLAAVEDAAREMKQSVDQVEEDFLETEAKAEAFNTEYKQQCFVAFREAKDIVTETRLATQRGLDKIERIAWDNFYKTRNLSIKSEHNKKVTYLVIFVLVLLTGGCVKALRSAPGDLVATFSCCCFWKKFLPSWHAFLADIETEADLLKLSERQMREVLEMCGVQISKDANQEKLLELLQQLWLHGERTPSSTRKKYVADDGESSKCKVCMDADIDCVILDCGHLVTCKQCGKKLRECPVCRQQVLEVLSVAQVTEQEMMKLTNQQVKRVLTMCGIGFKDRVSSRMKMEEEGTVLEHKCKVCMERVIDCVFLNCGHLMTCISCGQKLASSSHFTVDCPICQKRISRVAKIYRT